MGMTEEEWLVDNWICDRDLLADELNRVTVTFEEQGIVTEIVSDGSGRYRYVQVPRYDLAERLESKDRQRYGRSVRESVLNALMLPGAPVRRVGVGDDRDRWSRL